VFIIDKSKGKINTVKGSVVAQTGVEVYFYSFTTSALEGGEWSAARPGLTLPLGKTRYPFYKRLAGPPGPV